jgi:hypothetical protein
VTKEAMAFTLTHTTVTTHTATLALVLEEGPMEAMEGAMEEERVRGWD